LWNIWTGIYIIFEDIAQTITHVLTSWGSHFAKDFRKPSAIDGVLSTARQQQKALLATLLRRF
jgi:hypothetical protein